MSLSVGLSLVVEGNSSFFKQWVEGVRGASAVKQTSAKVSSCVDKTSSGAVLRPMLLDVSKDEAFQHAFGVCRGWSDAQVEVAFLHVCSSGDGTIGFHLDCEIQEIDLVSWWVHLPFQNAKVHFGFNAVDKGVGVHGSRQKCCVPDVDAAINEPTAQKHGMCCVGIVVEGGW